MTMRYAHLSPDHLAQAINVVGFGPEEEENTVIDLQARKFSQSN
jgi:hypothetical protein